MARTVPLKEYFLAQTQQRRVDPGTTLGIPVAFLLKPEEGVDFEFFRRGMREIGGTVTKLADTVVKVAYENRPTEVWVHSKEDDYQNVYNDFCRSELNVNLVGSYRQEGFAIDHSYNKASIPTDVDAYIRLFLVEAKPNSSWGAYYERRLKELFLRGGPVGLRKETVAIRAKLTGISAPRKGTKKVRNLENVVAVVRQLVKLEMTLPSQFETNCKTLAAFCGMADGDYTNGGGP